jgi:hypothetical protein
VRHVLVQQHKNSRACILMSHLSACLCDSTTFFISWPSSWPVVRCDLNSFCSTQLPLHWVYQSVRLRLKCDGTRAGTRFRLSAKRTSPFKFSGASVQSTAGSRSVHISGSNSSDAGYNMFRSSVKRTGYPFHSLVFPSLPLLCVTMCHHISTGLYNNTMRCRCDCVCVMFAAYV